VCSGHGAAVVRAGIRGLYTRLVVVHCGGVTPRADGPPGCPLQAGPSCTPPVGTAFHVPTEWPSAHPSAGVRLDRGGIRRQLIIANGLPHLVRDIVSNSMAWSRSRCTGMPETVKPAASS
jgi:hypothetical protein